MITNSKRAAHSIEQVHHLLRSQHGHRVGYDGAGGKRPQVRFESL